MKLFFGPSDLDHEAIPFDLVKNNEFEAALNQGLLLARANVDAIRKDTAPATFKNTIEALEAADEPLVKVQAIFDNYTAMNTTPELDRLAEKMNPELARFSNEILLDAEIFARVERVHESRERLGLSTEQMTLVEKTHRSFVRNGAKLSAEDKAKVDAIDQKLSVLAETFRVNAMTAVKNYERVVTDLSELEGLPELAINAAAETARKKGKTGGWLLTLQPTSYIPVLQYAKSRKLREEIWRASAAKAAAAPNDNRPLVLEIAQLRQSRAKLLGYETHAHYMTEERMAKNPGTVIGFLEKLAATYRPAAERELNELRAFAAKDLSGQDLAPWDLAYYSEKLREANYGYNEEELRPYFPLDQVIAGAFYAASERYGIRFHARKDLPAWHPTVRVYEVRDRDESVLGLFYLDPFPRDSKRDGAWMNTVQSAGWFAGEWKIPHVINVGNFMPPVENEPALLSLNDVTTIFHELGHGLHGLLTKAHYRSLSGANVAWDFVELPSQMNENWAIEPEVLAVYARHYKTGEVIPQALVEKVRKAETFQAGLMGLRQISLGMLDLAWHAADIGDVKTAEDVVAWEAKAMAPYRVLPVPAGAMTSTSFSHVFSGGYSAGYYSYKWADVLAADTFSVFKEKGVFDASTSLLFRREILEKGGTEKPEVLYRRFRGRDADPDALLRKEGLKK